MSNRTLVTTWVPLFSHSFDLFNSCGCRNICISVQLWFYVVDLSHKYPEIIFVLICHRNYEHYFANLGTTISIFGRSMLLYCIEMISTALAVVFLETTMICIEYRSPWYERPGFHCMMTSSIMWKYFPRYWPFVRGIHQGFDVFFNLSLNKRLSKQ